ncbi:MULTISPECIES: hypothetical protein [unclassified Chryseobacterium]|uniref:hypothetical protein n=1 Tax=unclassified Chryseobacterium TaxID=2593645 RepID=UPI001AE7B516|nr:MULTISPECIES: hypothetical protein [unclassified Chryseobacterium]MBP1166318.1 hypothetical protein [Chryseobacterium sp. PvR013]MDR4891499.1 hypothetical protein [Chryseobacterium sp. CFS7]
MKNIDIRNLAKIGVADVDVYKTDRRKYSKYKLEGDVTFYRSKTNMIDKLTKKERIGLNDSGYIGQFGFDKFNAEHCPTGSIIYYRNKEGKKITDKLYTGYSCPYLSIWPPKINKEKSYVFLYVSTENNNAAPELLEYECKELNENNDSFISITNKITVTKERTETVPNSDDKFYKIKIECLEPFEKDISVEAKYEGKTVGRLIVKANAKVYETTIQPVFVSFDSAPSTTVELKDHKEFEFVNKLHNFFNKQSFNQAYIKGNLAEHTHVVKFDKTDFLKDDVVKMKGKNLFVNYQENNQRNALIYNDLIENKYSALFYNVVEIQKNIEKMQACIKTILQAFKKNFKYDNESNLKKAKKFHEDHTATNAWNQIKDTLYKEYLNYKSEYLKSKIVHLNQDKIVYIFVNMSVEGGKNEDAKTQAYSYRNSGITHIFKSAIKDEDALSLVIHELGHSLGLLHTFEDEASKEINRLNTLITRKKAELDELNNVKVDLKKYFTLDTKYRVIQSVIESSEKSLVDIEEFEKRFLINIVGESSYLNDKSELVTDKKTSVIELESINLPDFDVNTTKNKVMNDIKNYESQIAKWTPYLGIVKNQSETLENIMDYRQFADLQESNAGEDGKPNFNQKFKYKSFYQWQWQKMVEKSVDYDYISPIKL